MDVYRIYVLSAEELVSETREVKFPNDSAALAAAEAVRRDHYAAEVWVGDRLVARLGNEFRL